MVASPQFHRATKADPCPHCGKPDWCYSIGDLSVCKRGNEPAHGWHRTSKTDKDGDYFYAPDSQNSFLPFIRHSHRLSPLPKPPAIELARLPQTPDKLKRPVRVERKGESKTIIVYPYSDTQQVRRMETLVEGQRKKRTIPYHQDESGWEKGKGDDLWNAYRIDEAIRYGKDKYVLAVEGEKCVEVAREDQIVCITWSGSNWTEEDLIADLSQLKRAKVKGLVYFPDHDQIGVKKAEAVTKAAQKIDFPVALVDPAQLWSEMPEKGDIADWTDQVNLTPEQRVQQLQTTARLQTPPQPEPQPKLTARDNKARKFAMEYERAREIIGNQLRFNERTREIEIHSQELGLEGEPFSLDYPELELAIKFGLGLEMKESSQRGVIQAIAKENAYDPIKSYLDECAQSFSDTSILDNLAETLFGTSDPIHQIMLRKTLIGCVARVYKPGCKLDTATVLYSPKQGIGKSTTWKTLFGEEFYCEDMGDISNKDEVSKLHRVWGCEWSEIGNITRKKDVDKVKQFLSTASDWIRKPYGRHLEFMPRRGVIVGTTNSDDFLRDRTGNRRFWLIEVQKYVDISWLHEHRDLIWGAAVHLYRQGVKWWLTHDEEEQSRGMNKDFLDVLPFEDEILELVSDKDKVHTKWIIENLGVEANQVNSRRDIELVIKKVLTSNEWESKKPRINGKELRGYIKKDTRQNETDVRQIETETSVAPEPPTEQEIQVTCDSKTLKNQVLEKTQTQDTPPSSETVKEQIFLDLRDTFISKSRIGEKQFFSQYPNHPDEVEAVLQNLEGQERVQRDLGYIYHLSPRHFKKGDRVVLLSGDLRGYHATVRQYNKLSKDKTHTYIIDIERGCFKEGLIVNERDLKLL